MTVRYVSLDQGTPTSFQVGQNLNMVAVVQDEVYHGVGGVAVTFLRDGVPFQTRTTTQWGTAEAVWTENTPGTYTYTAQVGNLNSASNATGGKPGSATVTWTGGSGDPGATPPGARIDIMSWIKQNPLIVGAAAIGLLLVLKK